MNYDLCWLKKTYTEATQITVSSCVPQIHISELKRFFENAEISVVESDTLFVVVGQFSAVPVCKNVTSDDGYEISCSDGGAVITAMTPGGLLYGMYELIMMLGSRCESKLVNPISKIRMINHWDNFAGDIERGYAGRSIFYEDNSFLDDYDRIDMYARLLASVGINAVSINNVNVHSKETRFITREYLSKVKALADIFERYYIRLYLSVNFAAPMELSDIDCADPLDERVIQWWKNTADEIYSVIPEFGGFVVKADSENRPGPFTYGRTHADGANMLGAALKPYGGKLIWRCFVYNCHQDWRDTVTDRAKAAYDTYRPLDGQFADNVYLQVKNGPMDFQVREPVSPLLGDMEKTNLLLEFQITQEYTGQQKDICYLAPMWKEILQFNTYADNPYVKNRICGIAGVSNIGNDYNWCGNKLAQANLFAYGRLGINPDEDIGDMTTMWVQLTFNNEKNVVDVISDILLKSWQVYENYNAPLGLGWLVSPNHHYGPSPDGYEYQQWGTYHRANLHAVGVDRTSKGTGYTMQYHKENQQMYEKRETCPEELLLFFHRVEYTYRLKSGKTLIQHIYDSHFDGAEQVAEFIENWKSLEGKIDNTDYQNVYSRLIMQLQNAEEWRDVINSYFYRKCGIPDEKGRKIYE